MKVFVVDGEEYFAVPEVKSNTCKGCEFDSHTSVYCPNPHIVQGNIGLTCNEGYIFILNTPTNRDKWAPIVARTRMKVGE